MVIMVNLSYVFLAFLGGLGFVLSAYLYRKKTHQKPFTCPLHFRCETVMFSRYSIFLGIPVEFLGMAYYGITVLSYGFFLVFPTLISFQFVSILTTLTVLAFIFSIYLTLVQAFALKEWCSWCLVSASICTAIFFLVRLV